MNRKESKVMRSFQIRMITSLARGKFTAVNLKNDLFVKWLIGYMTDNQIPFRLIPMGAGVTRIIQEGVLCPHCEGRGFSIRRGQSGPNSWIPQMFSQRSMGAAAAAPTDVGACAVKKE